MLHVTHCFLALVYIDKSFSQKIPGYQSLRLRDAMLNLNLFARIKTKNKYGRVKIRYAANTYLYKKRREIFRVLLHQLPPIGGPCNFSSYSM